MIRRERAVNIYVITALILLCLILGRAYSGAWDFSYFFVAGTDYVDALATPIPIKVQHGQGYDGQFFYKYAHNPIDFSSSNYGVKVDLVPYRIQRIMYPLLCWIASLGGIPMLVPYSLVLINVLAFIGIIYFTQKIVAELKGSGSMIYFPLFLCGLYMSIAKDLSELTELFFFLSSIYYLYRRDYLKFSFLASLSILTKETSLIALLPLVIVHLFKRKEVQLNAAKIVLLLLPFLVFLCWKLIILALSPQANDISEAGNIGLPFKGIIIGFMGNLHFSDTKNIFQFVFWALYFIWQSYFCVLILKTLLADRKNDKGVFFTSIAASYLTWFAFALFLSAAVYVDDWSFVRIFSLWNIIGFLILLIKNRKMPILFQQYSITLVVLTIIRLIIRP